MRGVVALFVVALLAACGGSGSSNLEASQSKHVFECKGKTPGFWCGGVNSPGGRVSPATEGQCTAVAGGAFTSCSDMCYCFVGEFSANAGQDREGCTSDRAAGDVLQKFWAALQLSQPGIAGVACEYPDGTPVCDEFETTEGDPFCTLNQIEGLIESDACEDNRELSLAIAFCIDAILNATTPVDACVSPN